ncbi:glutamate-rich protein 2 [Scleropages formosus]|uniref:Glutamate-rich protein 2 n=1 Tax=Scleropages formosus TaxID=113540 RepID=A0A8C9SXI8_SCLFO|nr:glutamate-rich protein 2 [Scleropages formosus]XP_018585045.1 glutamate-rich protein 2 [Scleropages formosus]XP_018585046.1 glutamate-rich protein 2 [Scleropages formosus]
MDTINKKSKPSIPDFTEDTPQPERATQPADDDRGCDKETPKAPFQLFAEFLKSVMGKDYTRAHKLCRMILIYEPENPEAKQFIPLIEEKLQMEQEEGWREEDEDSDVSEESENMSDSSCSSTDNEAVYSESSAEEEERS